MRLVLFVTFLIDKGRQSSTVKSYISAIRALLRDDGYCLNEDKMLLQSLTRACRLTNDQVHTRLPINVKLLEVLLFELHRLFMNQPYLCVLYKAIFAIAYYGLFRVAELSYSPHCIKAADVQMGLNKNKILIILRSSKTHGRESRAQCIRITQNPNQSSLKVKRHFCPFQLLHEYLTLHGNFDSLEEQLFIFTGASPVKPQHI